ncbi:MAG TPA: hypothetical protein VFR84_00590 [Candidatus Angelobacter sp.]|nr:hypothetical protein [Candidatus Angelobacter sp.]
MNNPDTKEFPKLEFTFATLKAGRTTLGCSLVPGWNASGDRDRKAGLFNRDFPSVPFVSAGAESEGLRESLLTSSADNAGPAKSRTMPVGAAQEGMGAMIMAHMRTTLMN